MRTVEAVIRELSQNDVPVLVVAEHGSGKAAAAARIHVLSSRAAEPFWSIRRVRPAKQLWRLATLKVEPSICRKSETSPRRPRRNWFARSLCMAMAMATLRAACRASFAEPRASWSPKSRPASSAKTFIMESAEFVCGCPRCVSGKKIFLLCATGFSPPPHAISPVPCRRSAPKPTFLPGVQLAGKYSRTERCSSSHCCARR